MTKVTSGAYLAFGPRASGAWATGLPASGPRAYSPLRQHKGASTSIHRAERRPSRPVWALGCGLLRLRPHCRALARWWGRAEALRGRSRCPLSAHRPITHCIGAALTPCPPAVASTPSAVTTTGRCAMQAKPNILLILNDDMGYSDLGCYGGRFRRPASTACRGWGAIHPVLYHARCCPSRARC